MVKGEKMVSQFTLIFFKETKFQKKTGIKNQGNPYEA